MLRRCRAAAPKVSRQIPSYRGELGRTYLALGRLARQSKDPAAADWFRKATATLEKTLTQSPDSAQDKKSLAEAKTEKSD